MPSHVAAPRRRRLASLSIAGLIGLAILLPAAVATGTGTVASTDLSAAETAMVGALNADRKAAGLIAVQPDARLMAVARARSDDMVANDYFSHTQPDGRDAFKILTSQHITWYSGGEIIAWNNDALDASPATANADWLASSREHAIVVSSNFNYVGVGVAVDPATGKNVWTAIFIKGPDRTAARSAHKATSLGSWRTSNSRTVKISWSGYDPRLQVLTSGFRSFKLQLRIDGGRWVTLAYTTTATSRTFTAWRGHRYEFRVAPRDKAGNWGTWTTMVVSLAAPAPTPAPTPTTDPAGAVVLTYGPTLTAATLQAAARNMSIDVIELTAGTYHLGNAVYFDIDRTSRPLIIRPAAGAQVVFAGAGDATASGQFYFGLNTRARWITMTGFTLSGYLLGQAGIFEIRQSDHVTINNMRIQNVTRDTRYSDKAYKTWGCYISRSNTYFRADGWVLVGSGRNWSGIQIDSGTIATSVHLTNMAMAHMGYAFYENVPTTDLLLDGWSISDSGLVDVSVSFHQAHGVYRNLHGTSSYGVHVNSSWMTSGGGNTWQ